MNLLSKIIRQFRITSIYNVLTVVLKQIGRVCVLKATQAMELTVLVRTSLYIGILQQPHPLVAIDVCINNGGCDPMATCSSDPLAPGGRTCTCQPGRYTGDGIVCLRTFTHSL